MESTLTESTYEKINYDTELLPDQQIKYDQVI